MYLINVKTGLDIFPLSGAYNRNTSLNMVGKDQSFERCQEQQAAKGTHIYRAEGVSGKADLYKSTIR
jgi:hypothetical protein